jgi:recombination protein RecA
MGMESSGKTSLIVHTCGVAQWMNPEKYIVVLDHEHTFDPNWARKLGMDPDRIIALQPDTAEDSMNMMINEFSHNKDIVGVLIDSVAAMQTKVQEEKEIGQPTVGSLARVMSEGLRMLVTVTPPDGPFYAFLNQIRMKVGQTQGSPETTSGGNALKFYASQRFDTRRDSVEESTAAGGDAPTFNQIRGTVKKNKVAPPFRRVNSDSFLINYDTGFDFVFHDRTSVLPCWTLYL